MNRNKQIDIQIKDKYLDHKKHIYLYQNLLFIVPKAYICR